MGQIEFYAGPIMDPMLFCRRSLFIDPLGRYTHWIITVPNDGYQQ
jgi:hypothetical protein